MEELPIPQRMQRLPRDKHGRVVPWFVAFIDGAPDFRIIREDGIGEALKYQLCWLCGQRVGKYVSFAIGPMCAVNRVTAEPGSHHDCAIYAVRVCPFLTTPNMQRREHGVEQARNPGGVMIRRNPGVTLVWTSRDWSTFPDGDGGRLIDVGTAHRVEWFARGRDATRDEVLASIESGLPILREMAEADPKPQRALAALERQLAAALELVPAGDEP